MIIELFGPAAAGKTTLSRAIETALVAAGRPARVVASARPGEQPEGERGGGLAVPGFLSRSAKAAGVLPILFSPRSGAAGQELIALMPPRNVLWSLRYGRYLSNIDAAWRAAEARDEVAIFDQAYLSALCSLVILSRPAAAETIARALDALPRPDILVRLDAPRDVLADRLRRRLAGQGRFERMFELGIDDNLRQIDVASTLDAMLQARARSAIRVASLDRASVDEAVARVVDEVVGPRARRVA